MTLKALQRDLSEVQRLERNGELGTPFLEKTVADWLVLRICSTAETHLERSITHRLGRSGDPVIKSFASNAVGTLFRNPSWDNTSSLLKRLGGTLEADAKASVPEIHKDALNTIVLNRHQLAHGGASSLTLREVLELQPRIEELLRTIDSLVQAV